MPLPTFSLRATLTLRLATVVGIVVGLLGMHVLMSPASHAAHGASATASAHAAPSSATMQGDAASSAHMRPSTSGHAAGAEAEAAMPSLPLDRPATSCAPVCADPTGGPGAGAWTIVCVLALLLTALLVLPRTPSWLGPWRERARSATAWSPGADRAPRHPPSLIVLSISRT